MNSVQIHSAAGLANAPSEALRVEKPPVPIVEKAWHTASNQPMPTQWSATAWTTVRTK